MKKPTVSVIITTKNEEGNVEALLQSINSQSYKNIEIIVVDNNSTDKTKEISKKYTDKVYNFGPERSFQRNFAVKKCKGKFILILDADMVLSEKVVSECINIANNNSKLGGIIIPEKSFGKGFWTKVKALEREINKGEDCFEAARFFPKKVFLEFKGYDDELTGPEDWDLPQRISKKYKILRARTLIRHNEGKASLVGFVKRKYYYGLSVHKYLTKQKIPVIGPRTIYFLRPAFYRSWRKLAKNPILTLGMIIMLVVETIGGGLGYIKGRLK